LGAFAEEAGLVGAVAVLEVEVATLAEGYQVLIAAIVFEHVDVVDGEDVAAGHVVGVVAVFATAVGEEFDGRGDVGPVGGVAVGAQVGGGVDNHPSIEGEGGDGGGCVGGGHSFALSSLPRWYFTSPESTQFS
jgi:hypothetical protein